MVTDKDSVWVTLEQLHVDYADMVSRLRDGIATDGDRVIGVRCEIAGKLFLNPIKWNTYGIGADLSDWIDVKGRKQSHHSLIIQGCSDRAWAYLLVCAALHPRYRIVGWCYGDEGMQEKYWADPEGRGEARAAYFIKPDNPILRPPRALRVEHDKRRGVHVELCKCGEYATQTLAFPYQSVGAPLPLFDRREWFCGECLKNANPIAEGMREAGH